MCFSRAAKKNPAEPANPEPELAHMDHAPKLSVRRPVALRQKLQFVYNPVAPEVQHATEAPPRRHLPRTKIQALAHRLTERSERPIVGMLARFPPGQQLVRTKDGAGGCEGGVSWEP